MTASHRCPKLAQCPDYWNNIGRVRHPFWRHCSSTTNPLFVSSLRPARSLRIADPIFCPAATTARADDEIPIWCSGDTTLDLVPVDGAGDCQWHLPPRHLQPPLRYVDAIPLLEGKHAGCEPTADGPHTLGARGLDVRHSQTMSELRSGPGQTPSTPADPRTA